MHPDPPFLEVHSPPPALLFDHDVGLHPVTRHRQQPHPRLPAGTQCLGHRRERVAGVEHLRSDDVGSEVAVAESEPGWPHAVRRQLLPDGEGLHRPAPALALLDAAAEGVHHGVEVGTDPQPEQRDVVGGVADHGHLGRRLGGQQPAQEPGASEAAVLLAARGADLDDLLSSAARVRDAGLTAAGRPGTVTYSRKVFIPLTHLCRDRCHYCTFATTPNRLAQPFLSVDEVLDIARQGAALGCKEALFTLGDRPEDRWPAARDWLDSRGYGSTLDYVRACAIAVLEQTGLLPHLNPGVLTWEDLARLKPVAPSMGMMLETTASRLWSEPGGPHFASPDKEPAVRLRVLEDAGRQAVPFTTGILVGIGETPAERADSLFAIRRVARRYG